MPKPMGDLSIIVHGQNHENADLAHRCRMIMLQLGDPAKWGKPRETTRELADELRKTGLK
jgi:hypothetical protein